MERHRMAKAEMTEPAPLSDAQQEFVNRFLRGETSQARLWRDGMQEIYDVVTALASAEQYWRLEYTRLSQNECPECGIIG